MAEENTKPIASPAGDAPKAQKAPDYKGHFFPCYMWRGKERRRFETLDELLAAGGVWTDTQK